MGTGISIDGIDLPEPSKFRIRKEDIYNSNLNELGQEQRDLIRSGRHYIELEYHGSTSSEIQTIEAAIEPVAFNITFPSPIGQITKEMHVEDRTGPDMIRYVEDYNKIRWRLNLVLAEY